MYKKYIFTILVAVLFLGNVYYAHATTVMRLLAESHDIHTGRSLALGTEFNAVVSIDTNSDFINAAEAKISFRNDVLEVVDITYTNSIFNFWLNQPSFSNNDGFLQFAGGVPKGVSGKALEVLKIKFRVKGIGWSNIVIDGASVTASDGKGTNVLSKVEGLTVVSYIEAGIPGATDSVKTQVPILETPQKVEREPISAGSLPQKPNLTVSLYPDQSVWYNYLGHHTVVFWDLPDDVIKIAADIDNSPYSEPQDVTSNLTEGKDFEISEDGTWYIHVQFKNNKGWGEIAHYKIRVDTETPLPFEIELGSIATNNPTPRINYHAHDWLSGISRAEVFIDGELVFTDEGELEPGHLESGMNPEPLTPGIHNIVVRIIDNAGNGVEDDAMIEILPIASPTIQFASRHLDFDGDEMVWGSSLPDVDIILRLLNEDGEEMFTKTGHSSSEGHWMINLDQKIPKGKYTIYATAEDEKGAQSYPSEGVVTKVGWGVVSLGFTEISLLESILTILLLVVLGLELLPCERKVSFVRSLFRLNKK